MINWKEAQVSGELLVAVHSWISERKGIKYAIEIYAIKIVDMLFTFDKTSLDLAYIKESAAIKLNRSTSVSQSHQRLRN